MTLRQDFRLTLALAALLPIACHFAYGQESHRREPRFAYDRLELLGRFLKAAYPELNRTPTILRVDGYWLGGRYVDVNALHLYPRHGGVPAPYIAILQNGVVERGPTGLSCLAEPTAQFEHYLDLSVRFAPDEKHGIDKFAASGKFVNSELQEVRAPFRGTPATEDSGSLDALLAKQPRYGPKNRREFLGTIQVDALQKATGCTLRLDTAAFNTAWDNAENAPSLEWYIRGDDPQGKRWDLSHCLAEFEPFAGHLTSFIRMP